jgi:hypothetical protein
MCHFDKFHYAECHNQVLFTEYRYAESHAECHYAEAESYGECQYAERLYADAETIWIYRVKMIEYVWSLIYSVTYPFEVS